MHSTGCASATQASFLCVVAVAIEGHWEALGLCRSPHKTHGTAHSKFQDPWPSGHSATAGKASNTAEADGGPGTPRKQHKHSLHPACTAYCQCCPASFSMWV
eukprot:740151-Pelagomonas_calceolata.AAC.6